MIRMHFGLWRALRKTYRPIPIIVSLFRGILNLKAVRLFLLQEPIMAMIFLGVLKQKTVRFLAPLNGLRSIRKQPPSLMWESGKNLMLILTENRMNVLPVVNFWIGRIILG